MRQINKLSATQVAKETRTGRYADGDGLYLQIARGGTKSWLYRFMLDGRARQMGLGAVRDVSLANARELATDARRQVRQGIDPIEARKREREERRIAQARDKTFRQCAEEYIRLNGGDWKNPKHRQQWENTLSSYAYPKIGNTPVSMIDTADVMRILQPIWNTKRETASRLRGRIEKVLNHARVSGYRAGDNPARWRGHLDASLPAKKPKPKHHTALAYDEAPAFLQKLRPHETVSARALEFTILTAARTNETIGATWGEIDLDAMTWTVPAERMKAEIEHVVPLCPRAAEILREMPREANSSYVFPGGRARCPLSNMAMLKQLKSMEGCEDLTVHGFRSTFRDWAGEQTSYPREVIEKALAHQLKDRAEKAYARGNLLDKRRRLMIAWDEFLATSIEREATNVTSIGAA